jgi:hypothetical protein
MASLEERLRFAGTLHGEGHDATCSVWATKVTLPRNVSAYTDYSIDDVSEDLPDGNYSATANGETTTIARQKGFWLWLPHPTVELVQKEREIFRQEAWLSTEALDQLRAQFPRNTDIRQVLLKVLVLNKLYSARVNDNDVEPLACHIVGLGIDPILDKGELEAVSRIAACPNLKEYLSFASKFCSWHNPTAYPIYDGNVRACLWSYKIKDGFTKFRKDDLWYYMRLVDIIIKFRKHYELESLTFIQLDEFMYRIGGQILKARKDQNNRSPAISTIT